jgi:hypothetical protein
MNTESHGAGSKIVNAIAAGCGGIHNAHGFEKQEPSRTSHSKPRHPGESAI